MIPETFEEWKDCIEKGCKIELTPVFAAQRLEIYENDQHQETQRFVSLYGRAHLQNIVRWLRRVAC